MVGEGKASNPHNVASLVHADGFEVFFHESVLLAAVSDCAGVKISLQFFVQGLQVLAEGTTRR